MNDDFHILIRRSLLSFAVAIALISAPLVAMQAPAMTQASDTAQRIADHFSSVRSMSGEFVQFGPQGEQTGGQFFLQRPGKIRFNYEALSNFKVISDGQSVLIINSKMRTSNLYPLSKTPLKILLDEHIDLSGNKVQSLKEDDNLTTIKLSNKHMFGNSTITMMFDQKSYDLRQWTITDVQGKDTTVIVFNVKVGGDFPADTFVIDYKLNRELNARKKND